MNSIHCKLDKSDYDAYPDFMNFEVDGVWLDEMLDELYPGQEYKGLVPTLLYWMELESERKVVWQRILPEAGQKSICPILMCPDDCDFFCTLLDAEIENTGSTIKWNRIGFDKTESYEPEKIGSTVHWFEKAPVLEFPLENYEAMLADFKKQFEVDKQQWEQWSKPHKEKLDNAEHREHPNPDNSLMDKVQGFISKFIG